MKAKMTLDHHRHSSLKYKDMLKNESSRTAF
jgi:hypothetical protein